MDVTGLYAKIGVTKTTEDDSEGGTATSQPWFKQRNGGSSSVSKSGGRKGYVKSLRKSDTAESRDSRETTGTSTR